MNFIKKLGEVFFRIKYARASMPKRIEMLRPKFYHLGKNVQLFTNSFGTEPYLISIEDDVAVASGCEVHNA